MVVLAGLAAGGASERRYGTTKISPLQGEMANPVGRKLGGEVYVTPGFISFYRLYGVIF